jgi:hypothetical protein
MCLTGKPADWDLVGWWGGGVIERHARRGLPTVLTVAAPVLRTLTFDTLLALNALIQRGAPNVRVVAAPAGVANNALMAAVRTSGGTKAWASIDPHPTVVAAPPEGVVVASGLAWIEPGAAFDVVTALGRARPALARIDVRGDLDGRIADFGIRFWNLIQERSVDAHAWLATGQITQVEYQDRYLFNPLAVALLASVLRALPGKSHRDTVRPTVVIRTMSDRGVGIGQTQPFAIFHDWRDPATRDQVLKAVVSGVGFTASVEALPRHTLPHGRNLRMRNSEGMILDIMLDQGFGYWRSRSGTFDFTARASEQAASVARGDVGVVGASEHPTTLILDLTKAVA